MGRDTKTDREMAGLRQAIDEAQADRTKRGAESYFVDLITRTKPTRKRKRVRVRRPPVAPPFMCTWDTLDRFYRRPRRFFSKEAADSIRRCWRIGEARRRLATYDPRRSKDSISSKRHRRRPGKGKPKTTRLEASICTDIGEALRGLVVELRQARRKRTAKDKRDEVRRALRRFNVAYDRAELRPRCGRPADLPIDLQIWGVLRAGLSSADAFLRKARRKTGAADVSYREWSPSLDDAYDIFLKAVEPRIDALLRETWEDSPKLDDELRKWLGDTLGPPVRKVRASWRCESALRASIRFLNRERLQPYLCQLAWGAGQRLPRDTPKAIEKMFAAMPATGEIKFGPRSIADRLYAEAEAFKRSPDAVRQRRVRRAPRAAK